MKNNSGNKKKNSGNNGRAATRIQFECTPALEDAIRKVVKMMDSNASWVVRTCLTVFFQERGLIPRDAGILPEFITVGTKAVKGKAK